MHTTKTLSKLKTQQYSHSDTGETLNT